MSRTRESLAQIAVERVWKLAYGAKYFDESTEVIVFGSMSLGLERPDSDIDVLCVGSHEFKLKTDAVDLVGVPIGQVGRSPWFESELASHIAEYGTWIKGSSHWACKAKIGQHALDNKRRRITAFLRSLPGVWLRLDEGFRVKYSVKLRRETQRLLLMERGTPVPPTKILDSFWNTVSKSPFDVHDRLRRLTPCSHSQFIEDLLDRIDTHFSAVQTAPRHLPSESLRRLASLF